MSRTKTASPHPPRRDGVVWRDWPAALRPRQWPKNLVVFAAVLYSGGFLDFGRVARSLAAFAVFCALSSAGYLVNDILDAAHDRAHPVKGTRPIAAGRISPLAAGAAALVLAMSGLAGAWCLGPWFAATAAAYLAVTLSYSCYWKHHVLLDLLAIAAAFLLRGTAGAVVLGVAISPWLLLCLALLAMLLALGKRRHELDLLAELGGAHRPVLADYSLPFLEQALSMTTSAALLAYALYAIISPTAQAHPWLVATVPPVLYAMLRYLYLIFHRTGGGQPEELFLTDRPLLAAVGVWLAVTVAALVAR